MFAKALFRIVYSNLKMFCNYFLHGRIMHNYVANLAGLLMLRSIIKNLVEICYNFKNVDLCFFFLTAVQQDVEMSQ